MNLEAEARSLSWPADRLAEALDALASQSGLAARPLQASRPPVDPDGLDRWLEQAASFMELELEPAELPFPAVESMMRSGQPTLVGVGVDDELRFLVLLAGGGNKRTVLAPDLSRRRVGARRLRDIICRPFEEPLRNETERLLDEADVARSRRRKVASALIGERLRERRVGGVWRLGLSPGAGPARQLVAARLPGQLVKLLGAHTFQYLLWIVSWWLVGRGALAGRFDSGWLMAWALLLLTLVPFAMWVTWTQGVLAIGTGALLKKRLLYGALRLEPEEIRHRGVGQLLGQVIESEAVESLALSGGLLGIVALVELVLAAGVLFLGAGGLFHSLLLVVWVVATLGAGLWYYRCRGSWTASRLDLTHDLVERLLGHRTRLAQESRERWHEGEDQALEQLLERSRTMDRAGAILLSIVPRGWFILGLAALAPAFVGSDSIARLAVGLGGILLAYQALDRLTGGIWHLSGAGVAWKQVAPIFHAAGRRRVSVPPGSAPQGNGDDKAPLLDATDLAFRYRDRGEPVLQGCNLRIRPGERILLEGPSGGGKSTLASLVTGLRNPQSGLILLGGLDRQTLGEEGWLRRVVASPQFHENHVLTETFAFNLLMGRRWPPRPEDLDEAERLCRELGLGELIETMPAGLLQQVGETGWQLSHGERSRLFIARALLQNADLVILDESFAALDPENLRRCLQCVVERARTLLVIAHP